MEFTIDGKTYDIAFGLRFIKEMDKTYKTEVQGFEFGIGVETAVLMIQMRNPVVLMDIIKAGTAHLKSKPSNMAIEKELEKRAEEGELENLFDEFLEQMESSVFLKPKLKQVQALGQAQMRTEEKAPEEV